MSTFFKIIVILDFLLHYRLWVWIWESSRFYKSVWHHHAIGLVSAKGRFRVFVLHDLVGFDED